MKAILLSLIVVLSPTVALSLDAQTTEILEKRTCQYLNAGWTLGETARAIRYAVYQNERIETGTEPESELVHIFVDGVVQIQTEAILKNAKKRCPQLFPRN